MTSEKLKYWLLLHHTPYIGPASFQEILSQFNDVEEAYKYLNKNAPSLRLHKKAVSYLQNPGFEAIENELKWAESDLNHIITLDHSQYPRLLLEINNPPPVIYAMGNLELLNSKQIAVVGSRNPSKTGQDSAYQFSQFLARNGFTITSGLALGVDGYAHKGALAAKGHTVAVTGTGLDRVYPARHRQLAHDILNNQGLIVSEFPLGTPPLAENFPRRNRIISGLSLGTLVVEAALQSGSLITARTAGEQGRDIFAIPGSIHNPLAKGCHQLIRQGAKLVETAEHILEELGHILEWQENTPIEEEKLFLEKLPAETVNLLNNMDFAPTSVDNLVEQSGLTPEVVSSILLVLELHGCIESLPGGAYTRIK